MREWLNFCKFSYEVEMAEFLQIQLRSVRLTDRPAGGGAGARRIFGQSPKRTRKMAEFLQIQLRVENG